MQCLKCGKWAGNAALLPGQPTDHLCKCPPQTHTFTVNAKPDDGGQVLENLDEMARMATDLRHLVSLVMDAHEALGYDHEPLQMAGVWRCVSRLSESLSTEFFLHANRT